MLKLVDDLEEVVELWPKLKELHQRVDDKGVALKGVDFPIDSLTRLLLRQEFLFIWKEEEEIESMIIGAFAQYPHFKVFRLNSLAGKLGNHWAACLSVIENWAISKGAKGFEFWGRPGLAPFLRSQGYKVGMTHYIKEVPNGQ